MIMDVGALMFLWCVDLAVPGLEMFSIIIMSMRSRAFAFGGACGAAVSTATMKMLVMSMMVEGVNNFPVLLLWLRRCSAFAFLFFSIFLFVQARNARDGVPEVKFFFHGPTTFLRGVMWGALVAVVNPSDIVATLAMLGCFAERGMSMSLCVQLVAFMAGTAFLWCLFLIFVVRAHSRFFLQKRVQRTAFISGACVFFVYAIRAAME